MSESCPARNPDVVHSRLAEGEVVLLHLESGEYHELNPTGAVIWDLLDGERTASEIAAELQQRVDDPPQDLDGVVEHYLDELRRRDLLD